jgi:DNA repair protein RecN (Recombination protein N)
MQRKESVDLLRELSVQNLALIEDARVELEPGYCAWTGETGAGKSLLLTAIGLVLGGKASAELVRQGSGEARASAVFELADESLRREIEEILGAEIEDDRLILTRRVSAEGRSQAHANGMPVAVGTLRRLGARLIDVHGQHEGRTLLEPDRQRDWLDAYAGLAKPVASYREARGAFESLRCRRAGLLEAAERREREKALLVFERDELFAAEPKAGEHDELTREALRLGNIGALRDAASEGYTLLYEAERSAQGLLQKVARRLDGLSESVPEFADAAADLERLADEAREIAYSLRGLGQGWDDDPDRLEEVESRLALYRRLSARFRASPDELGHRLESIEAQLSRIDREDSDLVALDVPIADAWSALKATAGLLSEARRRAAKSFAKAVQVRFKALGLGEARLSVEVETVPLVDIPPDKCPPEQGADRVEFLFMPNQGESPRPLRKIASGGELSRVTLAVKVVLAGVDGVPTLVFDEIDTGVGGRLGSALGKTLAELSSHHQVICVTHLPQMASYATHQWVIRKSIERGRTRTSIAALSDSERVIELAAMLRGDSAAESTRREALAMLLEARAP